MLEIPLVKPEIVAEFIIKNVHHFDVERYIHDSPLEIPSFLTIPE